MIYAVLRRYVTNPRWFLTLVAAAFVTDLILAAWYRVQAELHVALLALEEALS